MQRLEKQRHDHAATEIQRIWQGYKVRNANKPKGKKGKKGKKVRRPRPRRPTTLPSSPPAHPPHRKERLGELFEPGLLLLTPPFAQGKKKKK